PYTFEVQKNVLFKGNSSVKNGRFEFTFIIPKDINYAYGNGKISYYARSNGSDATGYFEDFIIGGNSGSVIADKKGPEIELYMNDESFVYNGLTNPNPVMIAKIKDESGINTTGNGIGHDLVVILDDVTENQMVLNDYYEATQDSFNSGKVRYPFENLAIGKHKLKVRAWDVLNNVSENVLEFTVMSDAKLALDHVLNYPNPFTTHTSFYFEHNQNGETFDIIIQIFTISGKLVKTIEKTQYMEGNRSAPIDWDGRDDFGDKIDKGVYIYKLKVKNQRGEKAEKIEKIVIL
ncbi:MAG: T9SS type A sorting domain-containing protein, partial [Bacteroidales bacterium]